MSKGDRAGVNILYARSVYDGEVYAAWCTQRTRSNCLRLVTHEDEYSIQH